MMRPIHAAYAAILDTYLGYFPDEAAAVAPLRRRLALPDDPHDRAAMAGHITGSGIILAPDGRVLLIFHEALGRWLQPGGHVDPGEWAWEGVLREMQEETGAAAARIIPWCDDPRIPLDINIHPIPARPSRGEGTHLHFDFQYLVRLDGPLADRGPAGEIGQVRWFTPGADDAELACVAAALAKRPR
ncbi:NUDIX hydrolase [Allostella vacuolata]|nr:NUDIX hydrolase [Stella vacuolata]